MALLQLQHVNMYNEIVFICMCMTYVYMFVYVFAYILNLYFLTFTRAKELNQYF